MLTSTSDYDSAQAISWLTDQFKRAVKPLPLLSIWEFCDQHLVLPANNAESGRYRSARTPYMREPMDCLSPSSPYQTVVLYTGTQVGKTQVALCTFYSYAVNTPAPMMFVFSNAGESRKLVQTRIDPMVEINEDLKERISSPKKNSTGDTNSLKLFPGGFLSIASGEAPASLRSLPCRVIFIDELDAMPNDIGGEGSVVELARKRTSTFGSRAKILIASTTTNKSSKIALEYALTDMRKCFVPCPKCGEMQLIDWKRFKWTAKGTHVKEVWMECSNPKCKAKIHNHDKEFMLAHGEWRATNFKSSDPTAVGFWLSGLYAPVGWQSWEACVTQYLKATESNDEDKLTAFYNGILAEPYEQASKRPEWENLYRWAKTSDYARGEIPNEVLFLTSGADVQGDRIECEVLGWGRNGRSYSIDHYAFICSPGTNVRDINSSVWNDYYNAIIMGKFYRADGVEMRTVMNAMDRNYATEFVNAFWLRSNSDRFVTVRGTDALRSPISSVKEDKGGKDRRGSGTGQYRGSMYKYFDVGSSVLKQEIYRNLTLHNELVDGKEVADTPFVCHFPNNYDDEYYRQLTAEEYHPPKKGRKFGIWEKIRERNEALDMRAYNVAMWYKLEVYRWTAKEYDMAEETMRKAQKKENTRVAVRQSARRVLSKGITV